MINRNQNSNMLYSSGTNMHTLHRGTCSGLSSSQKSMTPRKHYNSIFHTQTSVFKSFFFCQNDKGKHFPFFYLFMWLEYSFLLEIV